MVHSAFHPTKVDQISTKESWDLLVKTNLSPRSSYAALGKVNPIHEKWLWFFLKKTFPCTYLRSWELHIIAI